MIIDFHCHTTNSQLRNLHENKPTIERIEKLAEIYGIKKVVVLATCFPFKGSGLGNKVLLERVKDKDLFIVFGTLDAMNKYEEGMIELIELYEAGLISGIKLYPGYQDFSMKKIHSLLHFSEFYDIPIMFHSGELHHCCPKDRREKRKLLCGGECRIDQLGHLAHPENMEEIVASFPSVTFILSHLGNPYFEATRKIMKKYHNVHTDISGQFVTGSDEDTPEYKMEIVSEIKEFIALENGIDRVLFGTDFPIQSHVDSIALVKALKLSQADEEKIFWKNAAKILKLEVE
jgi:uncharacterized protein